MRSSPSKGLPKWIEELPQDSCVRQLRRSKAPTARSVGVTLGNATIEVEGCRRLECRAELLC
jgi:hypothetical protein